MADYVVNAVFQDNITQGAQAAAAALNSAAAAADTVTTAVTKTTASAAALAAKYDPLTQTTNALTRAQQNLANAQASVAAGVAAGKISQDQANGTLDTLQQKVLAAQKAVAALSPTVNTATTSTGNMGFAMRQLEVQAEQAIAGIATGQPVWMTLIQQGHQVTDVMTSTGVGFKQLGSAVLGLLSPTVLVVAGIAAVGAAIYEMGSSAETAQTQMIALQNQLRATRDDYTSMAAEIQAAARGATTGSFTGADTLTAAQTIGSQPNFQGTQAQLQALLSTAENMALVFNETLPQAAQTLAKAMQDPGSVAEDLATKHFPAMSQALADSVVKMANAGDTAGAFNTVLGALNTGTAGATTHLTPLQAALKELDDAFKGADGSGQGLGHTLGTVITDAAAAAVRGLADVVSGIEKLYAIATSKAPTAASANGFSGFGQYIDPSIQSATTAAVNAGTNVLTSSAGARGIFQLMPSSFPYTNIDDPNSNIAAGLSYLNTLIGQNHGNFDAATGSYNMGFTGYQSNPSAAAGYINLVHNANTSVLGNQTITTNGQQMTTAQAIQFWGQSLGLPQDVINLGMQIATVESGGRQFTTASANIGVPSQNEFDTSAATSAGAASPNGVVNTGQAAIDAADKVADSLGAVGSPNNALTSAGDTLQKLYAGLTALGPETDQNAAEFNKLEDAVDKAQKALNDALGPVAKLLQTSQDQTAANNALAAAYGQGGDAVAKVTAQQQAQQQLLQSGILPGMASYNDALQIVTAANENLAKSEQNKALAQQTANNDNQLQYIQAETDSLGMNNDQRTVMLAALQEEIKLKNQGIDVTGQYAQADIQSAASVAQATASYNDQKQALDSLASSFTSAFDSIGDAITQAFVQGQGAAVNWKNVMDSVIEQVLQQALKLTVLNPILNSINPNSNLPTLSTTFSALETALGGSGSSGGSNSSIGPGTLLQAGSLANTASGGGILNALGLGNFSSSFGGIGSTISGVLSTPLIGGGAAADAVPAAAIAGGPGAAMGAAAPSLTVGGLLSGAGLGFGAGQLVDSLFGARNQIGGMVGSGVGAAAGAAIGSIVPGVGTVLGGLFGGPMGSARGFISKGKAS